jgi:hypothetical protein
MPDHDDEASEHLQFGKQCFNAAWDLIVREERTPPQEDEMLLLAMTSRWHWGKVGGPEETSIADWQISHVACLLGLGDLALRFAGRALEAAEREAWGGWRLGSAHEGMARASATVGDRESRQHHFAAAEAALASEPDVEAAGTIRDQLATVP